MNPTIYWWTQYPLRTAAIACAAIGLVTSAPKITSQIQSSQKAESIRLAGQEKVRIDEAENNNKLKLLQVRAKLAESRYQQGLVFVSDPNNPSVLTTISEGKAVGQAGSTTGATVPDGTIVGDINGNTGVIRGGVATDVAFTGNTAIVQAAYQRHINPKQGVKTNGK
jgi:hypothetical protein